MDLSSRLSQAAPEPCQPSLSKPLHCLLSPEGLAGSWFSGTSPLWLPAQGSIPIQLWLSSPFLLVLELMGTCSCARKPPVPGWTGHRGPWL